MKLPKRSHFMQRIPVVAPLCTLVLLVLLGLGLPTHVSFDDQIEVRRKQVSNALDQVPFRIGGGRWNGVNIDIPPDAQRMLRLNGALSRRYRGDNGLVVNVLLVHCGDSRDMLGHYPPICYPANGWIETSLGVNESAEITLNTPSGDVPVLTYQYSRRESDGTEHRVRIFDTFILPNGGVTPHIGEINSSSGRYALAVQGVAQLQILTPAGASEAQAIEAAEELLSGMSLLMEELGVRDAAPVLGEGASSEE